MQELQLQDTIISFENVYKTFNVRIQGGWKSFLRPKYKHVKAIKEVSFEIRKGQLCGLIGENGAGKSTTIKLLLGILHSDKGTIRTFDLDPFTHRQKLMNEIGVVFGQRSILKSTIPVKDSFLWLKSIYNLSKIEYEKQFNLLKSTFDLDELIDRAPRELSLGQRRRCDISAALLHKPKLVLLDEPTIGLDYKAKTEFENLLKTYVQESQTTVLISSHDLGALENICDSFLILSKGKKIFYGDKKTMISEFVPKIYISLRINKISNASEFTLLQNNTEITVIKEENNISIFINPDQRLDEIIAHCYRCFEIEDLDVRMNSLEQILLGLD